MYGTYASSSSRSGDYGVLRASADPSPFRYQVQAGESLESIADKLNTSTKALLKLNPLLASGSSSSSSSSKQRVKLYPGQQLVVEKARDVSLPPPPACIDNGWGQMHVVRAGESLKDIASQYNTTEEMLRQDNRQHFPAGERGTMFAGQMLHVRYMNIGQLEPEEEVPVATSSSTGSSPCSRLDARRPTTISKYKSHRITRKDTFEFICEEYNIEYARLLQINRGRFPVGARAELVVGEQLIVPDLAASQAEERRRNVAEVKLTKQIHVVEHGETPYEIAERYRMSYDELREFNRAYFPKGYRGEIRAGNKLVVKRVEEENEIVSNAKRTCRDRSQEEEEDEEEESDEESEDEDLHNGYSRVA